MLSLIVFHRVLITFGILFCVGFAGWELVTWWVTRATGALLMGVLFLVLAAGLSWYLYNLRAFLGQEEGPGA